MNTPDKAENAYVAQIDGLRALAVLSVMLYHLNPRLLPGGFAGVDVFFVISGYVVSASMAHHANERIGRFILGFYARRVLRIFPALIVCLVGSALLATLLIPNSWLSSASQSTALWAFFGLGNLALVLTSDGYFSPRAEFNPFTHTWSLAVEEQFYVVFPLLFYAWLKAKNAQGLIASLSRHSISILTLLSIIYSVFATRTTIDLAYYMLPSRFWELAAGAFVFQRQQRALSRASWLKGRSNLCLLVGFALVATGLTLSDKARFPFPWAIPSVVGSALLIAGFASGATGPVSKMLGNPIAVTIGKLSYSLYLWHWPVYTIFRWTYGLEGWATSLAALCISFVLASASYMLVERHISQRPRLRLQASWRVAMAGIFGITLSWLLTSQVFASSWRISLSVTRNSAVWYPDPTTERRGMPGASCEVHKERVQIDGVSINTFSRPDCDNPPASRKRLYVIGDSHAGAYRKMLYHLTEEEGIEVRSYSRGGCSFLNLLATISSLGPDCEAFAKFGIADIRANASAGDAVLLASLRVDRLSDQSGEVADAPASRYLGEQRQATAREAEKIISALLGMGLKVIIDAPKPVYRAPPFRCSDWFNSGNPVCRPGFTIDRQFLLRHREPAMEMLDALIRTHPQVLIWDPFPILCPGPTCAAFAEGTPLFFDGDHLSGSGNVRLYPDFVRLLKQNWIDSAQPG